MRRSLLLTCFLAAVLALPGCGYTLAGRQNNLPDYVKTIGVPQFVNHSSVGGLDEEVTAAVRQEFVNRGRRVQPDAAGADAVVQATILSVVTTPIAITQGSRQASRYAIIITVSVQIIDKHADDKVLWTNAALQARDEYDVSTSNTANDANALLSSDQTARQRLAKTLAQSVVTGILSAF